MSLDVCFAVPYIEVEFGQRSEGYKIYLKREKCVSETNRLSKDGVYPGGYLGPERPLHYFEIPIDSLDGLQKDNLFLDGEIHTKNDWYPTFKGKNIYIEY